MKIAHLVSTFPPYFGGMGNATFGMAQESARRGHAVTVLTPHYPRHSALSASQGVAVVHLRSFGRYGNAAFLPQLFWMLDDYDIVHLHYPFFGGAEVAAFWRASQMGKKKRRLIVTYHMDAIADGFLGKIFSWHNRHVLPFVLSAADRIIVTSFDYAEHSLLKNHESKIKNKVVEIPLGVDTEKFSPREKDEELLRQHRIDPQSFIALFVGALDRAHQFKGVEVLLRAFKLFCEFQRSASDTARLMIVGDGALRPSYAALARELGVQEQTVFVGRVSADDLPRYYQLADMIVLPSLSQSEAFGMTLLEGMASGKPVIASNLPGVRKVVDKRNGLLVKAGDVVGLARAIEELASDGELRTKYGAAGRDRVLNYYIWKAVGDELERVYR